MKTRYSLDAYTERRDRKKQSIATVTFTLISSPSGCDVKKKRALWLRCLLTNRSSVYAFTVSASSHTRYFKTKFTLSSSDRSQIICIYVALCCWGGNRNQNTFSVVTITFSTNAGSTTTTSKKSAWKRTDCTEFIWNFTNALTKVHLFKINKSVFFRNLVSKYVLTFLWLIQWEMLSKKSFFFLKNLVNFRVWKKKTIFLVNKLYLVKFVIKDL